MIPTPPNFSNRDFEISRRQNDYSAILFDWYKYVGHVANFFASIDRRSPDLRFLSRLEHGILIGSLNRISRLMLACVALSHKGLFGETTAILDRCIFETAVRLEWLCAKGDSSLFKRFALQGLKSESEFKREIEQAILARDGEPLVIEKRMLSSIENYISSVPTTHDEIHSSKKLPDIASMLGHLGHERLHYTISQRMGSHHVHGTWPSLYLHYLEEKDEEFLPRDHNAPTHQNQYLYIATVVLQALRGFLDFATESTDGYHTLSLLLEPAEDAIDQINNELFRNDEQSS